MRVRRGFDLGRHTREILTAVAIISDGEVREIICYEAGIQKCSQICREQYFDYRNDRYEKKFRCSADIDGGDNVAEVGISSQEDLIDRRQNLWVSGEGEVLISRSIAS